MNLERLGIGLSGEGRIAPEIKALLKDVQNAMGIPWAPATWRVYSLYPRVAELFWERLRPVVSTEAFLQDSLNITEFAYREVSRWYRPGYDPELSEEDIEQLQWELDAFEFGNPQILLQQEILRMALAGESIGEARKGPGRLSGSNYRKPEIKLVDEADASEELKVLFKEIQETLGLPLLSSDYRAVAKWPGFLKAAWQDTRLWRVGRPEYLRLHQELAAMAKTAARRIAPPVAIDMRELRAAVDRPELAERIVELVSVFTEMMPGLLVSDAMFRIGASAGQQVPAPRAEGARAPRRQGALGSLAALAGNGRGAAAVGAGLLGLVAGAVVYRLASERRRQ